LMSSDPRLDKLANVLVNYSTGVRPGDLVRIKGSSICEPLLVALYRAVLLAGAHPIVRSVPDDCAELLLKLGSDQQLQFVDPLAEAEIAAIDVTISLLGCRNTKMMTRVPPGRQALSGKSQKSIVDTFLKRSAEGSLRWLVTEFPTDAA